MSDLILSVHTGYIDTHYCTFSKEYNHYACIYIKISEVKWLRIQVLRNELILSGTKTIQANWYKMGRDFNVNKSVYMYLVDNE